MRFRFGRGSDWHSKKAYRGWDLKREMSEWFPTKERRNTPGEDQKSQPSKKLAPSLVSANVHWEVGVGAGLDTKEEVGVGRLELEPDVMEETMMPFPLLDEFPPPDGVGTDVGFCPGEWATQ